MRRTESKSTARVVAINLLACLAIVSLPELAIAVLLRHPSALDGQWLEALRRYYSNYDRKIVQFLPECAAYDHQLTYLLKPGRCRVRNREHEVEYQINGLGTRDDEVSLVAAEVIVLGDSHAMGWGVDQSESFAELIESESGRKVLNLAISSYGTVRQLELLSRADTSRLETLIVQYCDNDRLENSTYESEDNRLPISDRSTYVEAVEQHERDTKYYPGKHMRRLVEVSRQLKRHGEAGSAADLIAAHDQEARAFLNALGTAKTDLRGVDVVVLEINGYGRNDGYFLSALDQLTSNLSAGPSQPQIRTLDLSAPLDASVYFPLDGHMTADGHRVVADALLADAGLRTR